ncbi:MAG: redoxin family protein [Planctomycetota bacterium]
MSSPLPFVRIPFVCVLSAIFACLVCSGDPRSSAHGKEPISAATDSPNRSDADDLFLPEFSLQTALGRQVSPGDFVDDDILVVAFLGTECPLAKFYAVEIQQITERRGVKALGVMSNRQDSLAEIAAFQQHQELEFLIAKDVGQRFADSVNAQRTPEVLVFDADRRLRYRGRVDDRYGIGYIRDKARRKDLEIALDELIEGKPVSVPVTEAVGCIIGRASVSDVQSPTAPTYHGDVASILQRRCVTCHQEGEIAPFALTQFDDAAGWADMIVETVESGRMPPWHAGPLSDATFANERKITDDEIATIKSWADAGTPMGDRPLAASAAAPSQNEREPVMDESGRIWQLPRTPDHVFAIQSTPFEVPAVGEVSYQYYRVDPGFDRDVWVSAMQLRPGNPKVVHHILAFAVKPGQRRGIQSARSYLDGFVPGYRVEPFQDGYAKLIPAGSELVFQVHYTPTGRAETDRSEFAIVEIEPAKVTNEVRTDSSMTARFAIPPGEPKHHVEAAARDLPAGSELLAMMPHMHVRGKSFRYELSQKSGWFGRTSDRVVLDIPRYDFNWQTAYVLDPPIQIGKRTSVRCQAVFDNSTANLNNPDPTSTVYWGDQTWEEMMIGYFHYAVPRKPRTSID